MAGFTVTCFLLTVAASSLGMICGLETDRFPTSGANNRSNFATEDADAVDAQHTDEMSRMMENHLLRMLKLSARPPADVTEASVPGYVRALQLAVDSVPPSAVTLDGSDHLTWAVKAVQGTVFFRQLVQAVQGIFFGQFVAINEWYRDGISSTIEGNCSIFSVS